MSLTTVLLWACLVVVISSTVTIIVFVMTTFRELTRQEIRMARWREDNIIRMRDAALDCEIAARKHLQGPSVAP